MGELDLDWSKLSNIMNDWAPSMVGALRGLIGCMNREMEERGFILPGTSPLPDSPAIIVVMKVVVTCVNFIRANRLNHRQFQASLSELEFAQKEVKLGQSFEAFFELLLRSTPFF